MRVVVVGGGSWGSVFAALLAERGHDVTLACRDPEQAQGIAETGHNPRYLTTVDLRDVGPLQTNNGSASPSVLEFGRYQTVPNALLGLWFIVQPTDQGVVLQQPVTFSLGQNERGFWVKALFLRVRADTRPQFRCTVGCLF